MAGGAGTSNASSSLFKSIAFLYLLFVTFTASLQADERQTESYHAGILHPDGVDIIGYTNETKIENHIYRFYTFGFPSLAAVGINFYADYYDNGINANIGVGVGTVAYASLNYRWVLHQRNKIRFGAGFMTGVAYTGWYPVISYETNF